MKSTFLKKISIQDPFWTDLGPIWAPKRAQKLQVEPKLIVCASRIPPRHLAAGTRRLGGSKAWRLRSSDTLILATSWIFLMASGELLTDMFYKQMTIVEHNRKDVFGER